MLLIIISEFLFENSNLSLVKNIYSVPKIMIKVTSSTPVKRTDLLNTILF